MGNNHKGKERIEMSYEGFWSRFFCAGCENTFDVEGDVTNGDEVTCDACGVTGIIGGR